MVSKIGDRYEATFEKFETIRDTEKPVIFIIPLFTNLTKLWARERDESKGSVLEFERIDLIVWEKRMDKQQERKRERERCDFVDMVRL